MSPAASHKSGTALEVLLAFLRLGGLSFGGPIAHLGYFHAEFVTRRRWCTADTYAEILALAQSLPGPASSQTAFALGLLRARWLGALAAWIGFTLPSALLLIAFALGQGTHTINPAVLHGLQLVAVAIVAQAILSMQRTLAPDLRRIAFAIAAAILASFAPASAGTILPIALGALAGTLLLSRSPATPSQTELHLPITRAQGLTAAGLFLALLLLLPPLARSTRSHPLAVFDAFYRTGALVFGGGHVVLPLLEHAVVAPGWISQSSFLAGYGAAQAIPGPLFTFAAFLGADIGTRLGPTAGSILGAVAHPFLYAALSLIAIFLPGMLLLIAALPFWATLHTQPRLQAALHGINASVLGVLCAAWVRPVCSTAVHTYIDVLIAAAAFLALTRLKAPPWAVVLLTVALALLTPRTVI
ncbi:MAG TPA: chromate efflux transporter [Granulicella sp.]|nr:chromate efflux transporter [Granulicella sp.]